jgi:predicted DCC family thiol-disulfide oxidoreductase YuxK
MDTPAPIVFYDGDCGLCNRSVHYILAHRKKNAPVYFAALQSDFTNQFFGEKSEPLPDLSSIVVYTGERFLYQSDGVLFLTGFLRNHRILGVFRIIPKFLRNFCYRLIAANRKRIGSQSACLIPSVEDTHLFLG